jgi:transposase
MYLPGADGGCFEMFLEELGKAYSDHHLLIVLDNAPSHTSKQISHPENVSLLPLPAYSPELNPVERWFLEFRRALSNKTFETIEVLQEALTKTLEPYWEDLALLQRLTAYSWWMEAIEEALDTS